MRKAARALLIVVLSLLTSVVLGVASVFTGALTLAATTALIVPGTGTPDANNVTDYLDNAWNYYIAPTNPAFPEPCTGAASCDLVGINYPASFWPLVIFPGWCDPGRCEKFDVSVAEGVGNLDSALGPLVTSGETVVIFGYSQGARVVTVEKINLANSANPPPAGQVSFVYIGNTNRPNGGILSRFGILGHIPILDVTTGQPTPTNTPYATTDYAIRWEGIADFPLYLGNPLAVTNSLLGFYFDHGTYLAVNGNSDPGELPGGWPVDQWQDFIDNPQNYPDIVNVQQFGDTKYVTIAPKVLPLVRPLQMIPVIGTPIANLLEPALRVIIEHTGYNRSIPFGQPMPIQLIPIFNPITLALDLIPAVIQGIGAFLGDLGALTTVAPPTPAPVSDTDVTTLADSTSESERTSEPELRLAVVPDDDATEELQTEVVDDAVVDEEAVADDLATATAATDGTVATDDTAANDDNAAKTDESVVTKPEETESEDPDATETEETADVDAEDADNTVDDKDDDEDDGDDDKDADASADTDNEQAAA